MYYLILEPTQPSTAVSIKIWITYFHYEILFVYYLIIYFHFFNVVIVGQQVSFK